MISRESRGRCFRSPFATALVGLAIALTTSACAATTGSSAPPNTLPAGPDAFWPKSDNGCAPNAPDGGTFCQACGSVDECSERCAARDGSACTILGMRYEHGMGVTRNTRTAHELIEKACQLDSAQGCIWLAVRLSLGVGCERNERAALDLYEGLCARGHAEGCTRAGIQHIAGRGADASSSHGIGFLKTGCARGDRIACRLLKNPMTLTNIDHATSDARTDEVACVRGDTRACQSGGPPEPR